MSGVPSAWCRAQGLYKERQTRETLNHTALREASASEAVPPSPMHSFRARCLLVSEDPVLHLE